MATNQPGLDGLVTLEGTVESSDNGKKEPHLIFIGVQSKRANNTLYNNEVSSSLEKIKTLLDSSKFTENELFRGDNGEGIPFFIGDMFSNKDSPVNNDITKLPNNPINNQPYSVVRGDDKTVGQMFKRSRVIGNQ